MRVVLLSCRICHRRYKGVKLHRLNGQWEAQIKSAGKLVYLGIYEEEGEAAEAYDQALIAVQVHPRGDDDVCDIYPCW